MQSSSQVAGIPPEDQYVDHLIDVFNQLFQGTENTVLAHSDGEPIYLPADDTCPHARILFAHGYFASALHEIAHWCVAGPERRKQVDFGYWYAPDGRSPDQQQAFELFEVKPQAIEWILARAAGFRFRVSCDNLLNGPFNLDRFMQAIHAEVLRRFAVGLPDRTERLVRALIDFYRPGQTLSPTDFALDDL